MRDLRGLLGDLYMNFAGSRVLLVGVVSGLVLVIEGVFGIEYENNVLALRGAWERAFGILAGSAMILAFGGTYLLYRRKNLKNRRRFLLKLAVLLAFMLLGPLLVAMRYSYVMADGGFWAVGTYSLCTLVPSGIALLWTILERRKS